MHFITTVCVPEYKRFSSKRVVMPVLLTKTCSAASSVGGNTGWTAWTTENLVSPESKTGT